MGRPEKPVDQTIPELALLATFLREERVKANKSYAVLATCTYVSEATLKRAAAGTALPTWRTVGQYLHACYVQGPKRVHVRIAGLPPRPLLRRLPGRPEQGSGYLERGREGGRGREEASRPSDSHVHVRVRPGGPQRPTARAA